MTVRIFAVFFRRRGAVSLNFSYPKAIGAPTQIVSHLLPFLKISRAFGFAKEQDELIGEGNFPTALRTNHTHVSGGKEFADNAVMEEIRSLFRFLILVWFAHILH